MHNNPIASQALDVVFFILFRMAMIHPITTVNPFLCDFIYYSIVEKRWDLINLLVFQTKFSSFRKN